MTAPPPASASRRARLLAGLFAAGVVALGLYGLAFLATLSRRLPSASDWRQVAAALARESREGDAVALAPWWAERARAFLPHQVPLLAFPRLAGELLPGVRRVWVIALPRAPGGAGDVERDLAARGRRAGAERRFGALSLARYDLAAPALPLFTASARLATASATLAGAPCRRDAGGTLRCQAPGAPHIVAAVREVAYLPRRCLVVGPLSGPAPLALSFPDVPLGRALEVFTGIVGESAFGGTEPVAIAIALGGKAVATAEERPKVAGWHRTTIDTAARAGRTAALEVTVRSGEPGPRQLCLEAYALP